MGAGPPEAVRIRVHPDRAVSVFPRGTELRGLSRESFESLLARARERSRGGRDDQAPRIVRTSHQARWVSGTLEGESELVIWNPGAAPALARAAPWGVPVAGGKAEGSLVATADGGIYARAPFRGLGSVRTSWRLAARSGTQGRVFALSLPQVDVSELTLDLPVEFEPDIADSIRQGPFDLGEPRTDGGEKPYRRWRFVGAFGAVSPTLKLRDSGGAARASGAGSGVWVGGPTRVDLDEAIARWAADWTIDPGSAGSRKLIVEFDPGLEPVDITGPAVVAFAALPAGEGGAVRLSLRLAEEAPIPTPITVRAVSKAPAQGWWSVPAARVLDAAWTSGKTVIRVGPGRVVSRLRPRSGVRVSPRADDAAGLPTGGSLYVFEAGAPESAADLELQPAQGDVAASVSGTLDLKADRPAAFSAQVEWSVSGERAFAPAIRVSPGWSIVKVSAKGDETVVGFQEAIGPDQARVVRLDESTISLKNGVFAALIEAVCTSSDPHGPLTLPRVEAPGARAGAETWTAEVAPELSVRPLRARGIAWLANEDLTGTRKAKFGSFAWRYSAKDAEVVIDRELAPAKRKLRAITRARIHAAEVESRLELDIAGPVALERPIAFAIQGDIAENEIKATIADEASERSVRLRRLSDDARARLKLPSSAIPFALELPGRLTGPARLRCELRRPWSGSVKLPIIVCGESDAAAPLVIVESDAQIRTTATTRGCLKIDPQAALLEAGDWDRGAAGSGRRSASSPSPPPLYRPAHAYLVEKSDAWVEVTAEPPASDVSRGFISSARYSARPIGAEGERREWNLVVFPAGTGELEIAVPGRVRIVSCLLDGRPVAPIARSGTIVVPLAPPGPVRRLVDLVYEANVGAAIAPGRAPFSLPVAERENASAPSEDDQSEGFDSWRRLANLLARRGKAETDPEPRLIVGAQMYSLADALIWADAGETPLVVDAEALLSAGLGPESALAGEVSNRSLEDFLARRGLAITRLAFASALTTAEQSREGGAESLSQSIREAVAYGEDASGRFRTVRDWLGAETPAHELGTAAAEIAVDESPRGSAPAARLRAPAIALALAVAGLGFALARRSLPVKAGAIALLAAVSLLCVRLGYGAMARGMVSGTLAAAAFQVGFRARRPQAQGSSWRIRERSGRKSLRVKEASSLPGKSALGPALVLAAAAIPWLPSAHVRAGAAPRAGEVASDPPIIAVFPFAGEPDPNQPGDRVLISLADYKRLRALADAPAAEPAPVAFALRAEHVVRLDPGDRPAAASVTSRIDVVTEGRETPWRFPVSGARDLTLTIDGEPAPLKVEPGGTDAYALIEEKGEHVLELSQKRMLAWVGSRSKISVLINEIPCSRVRLAGDGSSSTLRASESLGPADRSGAEIGPSSALRCEATSGAKVGPARASLPPAAEALMLWDIEPAGDRLRMRLTYRSVQPIGIARVRLEPGLIVRSALAPGLIDAVRDGDDWMARVEPSASPEAPLTITLDLWRSRPAEVANAPERLLPKALPLGVSEFKGALALRTPAEWSGTLGPIEGTEPMTADAFAAAWGDLPDDLAVSGVTRFNSAPDVAVASAPEKGAPSCRSNVSLTLGAAGIDVDSVSVLENKSGGMFEAIIDLGAGFALRSLEAAGLVNWLRLDDERVMVRFDGSAAARREIRIKGWLPDSIDPMLRGPARPANRIFWPIFEGAAEQPGTLLIDSPGPFETDPPQVDVGDFDRNGERRRALYRIDRPVELRSIRRRIDPVVKVAVSASLAILRDSLRFEAKVRYETERGTLDALLLGFPIDWVKKGDPRVTGGKAEWIIDERRGVASCRITPDADSWRVQEITLRAVVAREPGAAIVFPKLAPLGKGSAETLLAVENASGTPISFETTRGLRRLEAGLYFDRGGASTFSKNADPRCFEVIAEDWSLTLREGAPARSSSALHRDEAPVILGSRIDCRVDAQGGVEGLACYDIQAAEAGFLRVHAPVGASIVWAEVDDQPVSAGRFADHWEIPVVDRRASVVRIVWIDAGAANLGRLRLPVPETTGAAAPTLLKLRIAPGRRVSLVDPRWERLGSAGWDIETIEADRRRLERGLRAAGWGVAAARPPARAALAEFELEARDALRRGRLFGYSSASLVRIESAQAAIERSAPAGGFEKAFEEAKARISRDDARTKSPTGAKPFSLARTDPLPPAGGELVRVRGVLDSSARGDVGSISLAAQSPSAGAVAALVLAATIPLIWAGLFAVGRRPPGAVSCKLIAGLSLASAAALAGVGPIATAAALVCFAFGRACRV